jgi:PAS domain-containing protein
MADSPRPVSSLTPTEAARWLNIDEVALHSLMRAGFISSNASGDLALTEVKAFAARNGEHGGGVPQSGDFTDIIHQLEGRIDELANRAQATFSKLVVETRQWSDAQRDDFIAQARGRFDAILAVMSHGSQVDEALREDLEYVGATASRAGASLPHLQLVLRISRDLLLQSALKIGEESHGRMHVAVDEFISRLLPAIDNLLDAISHGFWSALLDESDQQSSQMSSLFEKLPYPIYEADLDGLIRNVNEAFARMFRRSREELQGIPLTDVIRPVEGDVGALLAEPKGDVGRVSLIVESPIGGNVRLEIDTAVRRIDDSVEGFAGLMRIRHA